MPAALPAFRRHLLEIDVYYMNVDPATSRLGAHRCTLQEQLNPNLAAAEGVLLDLHRIAAVTPDSDAWHEAQKEYGDLVMQAKVSDSAGAAASCILVSFRQALHRALEDSAEALADREFVMITEDDMTLRAGFEPHLQAIMAELRDAPSVMGAVLHSSSLEDCASRVRRSAGGAALFESWPRYPRRNRLPANIRMWAEMPVIPDEPLVLLLKTARLADFTRLYEQRLRKSGWSPLDWLLANAPFGDSGALRLAAENCICSARGSKSFGSSRKEQHVADFGGARDAYVPLGVGSCTQALRPGRQPPRSGAREKQLLELLGSPPLDLQEPMLLLGNLNNWSVDVARRRALLRPLGAAAEAEAAPPLAAAGEAPGGGDPPLLRAPGPRQLRRRDYHLEVDWAHGGVLVFQIISARQLWDWRLFPKELGGEVELRRGAPGHVAVGLAQGGDDARAHGRNFRIRKSSCNLDVVDVRVRLSESEAGQPCINVWYD